MKLIALTKGKFAKVDDSDYGLVSRWKWYAGTDGYAARTTSFGGKRRNISMHRFLLSAPDGMQVDHINGDRLDNRRENIRLCTKSENMMNTEPRKGVRQPKGVHFHKGARKWMAQIAVRGERYYLGLYDTAEDASRAYVAAAQRLCGAFARTTPFDGVR